MHKAILDSNVILSGLLYGGTPAVLLGGIQQEKFILCTSQKLYDEIYNKLIYKFQVDQNFLNDVLALLGKGRVYIPSSKAHFPEDPDDAYLLDLAEESHAKYLVTEDKKHLLPLKNWKETQIISPSQASKILLEH